MALFLQRTGVLARPLLWLFARMKGEKTNGRDRRASALQALKLAILEGATWRYELLVSTAVSAGASDDDIDGLVRSALETLFASAEQPVTARQLAHLRSPDHLRR